MAALGEIFPAGPDTSAAGAAAARRRARRMRVMAALLSVSLVAPGCAQMGGNQANLTPAQQQLRDQNQRWWQTAGTGAAAGAALGAVAGMAAGGNDRRNALVGALIGGIAGSLAGVTLANRTLGFENREASATTRIASAQQTAANLEQAAATAQQVTAENTGRLEALDRQYRARQITAEQYRQAAAPIRQDKDLMERTAADARDVRQRLVTASARQPELGQVETRIAPAQRSLEASAARLDDLLRRVPAG